MKISAARTKIAVFAYSFPHKKTQDFLFHLLANGLKPDIVIAEGFRQLNIPASTLHFKPRHIDLVSPKEICQQFGLNFVVLEHNSTECVNLLREVDAEVGIIAGARILEKVVIETVRRGILNFHPGLLPQARGLDALLWSIYYGHPLGVTAHLINEKIDHGRIVKKVEIAEYPDDTLIDLSLRLEEHQNILLCETVRAVLDTDLKDFIKINEDFPLNKKMPANLEAQIPRLLQERLKGIAK